MAKSPPQFNFYYNDWLGGTKHLTPVERAAYLDLLIYQWQKGFIPLNESDRMVLCDCTDVGAWRHIWSKLRDKFEAFDLDETTVAYRNERMNEDREVAITVWKQRVSASKKAANSRKKKRSTVRCTERYTERYTVSDKDKDKDKDTNKKKKTVSPEAEVERLPVALHEPALTWIQYKSERGEAYKPTGLRAFVSNLGNRSAILGASVVIARIESAMANGWKGWDHELSATTATASIPEDF